MTDIPVFIQKLSDLNHNAMEATKALPKFMSETGDVTIVLADGSEHSFPSVAKLQEELSAGNLGERLGDQEVLTRGIVQEIESLADEVGLDRDSPYWVRVNLEEDGEADFNFLVRAEIEDGLRMPDDGLTVENVDRRFEGGAARIGEWLLPNYTETVENRFSSVPGYNVNINTNQYPIGSTTRSYTRTYRRRVYRYGRRYRWLRFRRYRHVVTRSYTTTVTQSVAVNLQGSMTAQTFKVDAQKVLTGIDIYCHRPGTYKNAANPRVVLVESSFGQPDLDKVVAHGTFRDNGNFNQTGTSSIVLCSVDLDRPVLLEANKSYAFVVLADSQFLINYTGNQDRTGGIFYTQDAVAWTQDIQKDFAYALRFAQFEAAEQIIEIQPIELSGGIAAIKQDLLAEIPEGGDIRTEFELNGTWLPVDEVDNLPTLPPRTLMRMVLTGTTDALPLVQVTNSTITGLRSATRLQYYTKERAPAHEKQVMYELTGFDDRYHTFDPALLVDEVRHTPSLVEIEDSPDGTRRQFIAFYELPESTAYRHDIQAETTTSASVFDISSVIEFDT
ncbi:hypothetical protein [Epibacterium ulvae]|uniref:hypothetical protein n=1 Tax=Epibacterium ulvae TaxID=1156985 RepID=UPI002491A26E|nr:hypothetical protein [Epibacterium ulvae]